MARYEQRTPTPTDIKLNRAEGWLDITFSDGLERRLSAEYLRVHSPSAEVKGHGAGEGFLVSGKRAVKITRIEPVGNYAVRLVFDDGHNTGLYSWPVLYDLALDHERKWQRYLDRLAEAAQTRDGAR